MRASFRAVEKESVEVRLPVELAGLVRERAARERRSLSEITSEIVARGMGRDPAAYGIGESSPCPS